jgi:hypothetical protein
MSAEDGPMDVARRVFAAFESRDWPALAALVDPAEQQRSHEAQLAALTSWAQARPDKIAGTGMRSFTSDGDLDPALLQRFADTQIPAFREGRTLGQLAGLSPRAFMVESLAASHGGSSFGFGGLVSSWRVVLGAVIESEQLAHVAYRTTVDGDIPPFPWRVSVLSLARGAGGDWLLMPDDEFTFGLGFASMLFGPPGDGAPAP